jgi:hypothetical protein
MNLEKFIRELNEVDEDLIIFQKDKLSIDSEIALLNGEGGENGVIIKDGAKYLYLLEVFIAKEFIADWKSSLKSTPTDSEIALRLFEFAINDA